MSDLHDDALVAGAFAAFRAEVAPHVRPVGAAAAHETVRHRRRVRTMTATALAALVIGVPVVAYAAVNGDPHGPPVPASSGGASPAPSATQPAPSTSPSAPATPSVPDGRILKSDLGAATLQMPAWGPDGPTNPACPTGAAAFTNGYDQFGDTLRVTIEDVVYADVDHDGAQETVARLSCGGGPSNVYQVVAFDRDAAGGIVTLGQVAVDTSKIQAICGVRANADGTTVEAQVGDYPSRTCESGPTQFQWRGYAWDGTKFSQVSGPTSFPVNPKITDLQVSTTDEVFGPMHPVNGGEYRTGTITVTVKNSGPSAIPIVLTIDIHTGDTLVPQDGCTQPWLPTFFSPVTCQYGSLAVGATKVVTVQVQAFDLITPPNPPRVSVHGPDGYGDWNEADNTVTFTPRW